MPPKRKTVAKLPPPKINTSVEQSSNTPTSQKTISGLDPEAEDQFELELCWCIQQLQMSVDNNKLPEKQFREINKTINVLKSSTAPLVKKRQLMRSTFGDYRKKMTDEEKKFNKIDIKYAVLKPNEKCVFLKRANTNLRTYNKEACGSTTSTGDSDSNVNKNIFNVNGNHEPFMFNFEQPNK